MSRILLVHGSGCAPRSEASLRLEWLPAMLDGLALCGEYVEDLPVTFVDIGSAVPPERAGASSPGDLEDWELAVARHWWKTAIFEAERPALNVAEGGGVGTFLEAFLAPLGHSSFFTGMPVDQLEKTIRAAHSYLFGSWQCSDAVGVVRDKLGAGEDISIVVAHSLGSVVAFRALREARDHRVHTFVTLGSPLGMPDAMGRNMALTNGEYQRLLESYPAVSRWVNIVSFGDSMAVPGRLAPICGERVVDVLIDEALPRLRAVRPYLATKAFGAALGVALAEDSGS